MSHRAWPAAVITGAALAAALVVVGEQVADAANGCLDSTGWFTATPVGSPTNSSGSGAETEPVPNKTGTSHATSVDQVGQARDDRSSGPAGISGCLDLDRIEIPAPPPATDDRA